jgi:hypothetical protein
MDCNSNRQGFVSRREFLFEAGGGLSGIALAHLLDREGLLAAGPAEPGCGPNPTAVVSPVSPRTPHFPPRARAVISLFMSGGVSQVDTFDPKPDLERYHGQPLEGKGEVIVGCLTVLGQKVEPNLLSLGTSARYHIVCVLRIQGGADEPLDLLQGGMSARCKIVTKARAGSWQLF